MFQRPFSIFCAGHLPKICNPTCTAHCIHNSVPDLQGWKSSWSCQEVCQSEVCGWFYLIQGYKCHPARRLSFLYSGVIFVLKELYVIALIAVSCCATPGFLRSFRDSIRIPRFENRVPRIREIGSPQVHPG